MPIFYLKIIGTKWEPSQRIVSSLDDAATIRSVAPRICEKLGILSLQGYHVFQCDGISTTPVREIDIDQPISTQNVSTQNYFYFAPADQIPAGVVRLPHSDDAAALKKRQEAEAAAAAAAAAKNKADEDAAVAAAAAAAAAALKKKQEEAAAAAAAAAAKKKADEDAAKRRQLEKEEEERLRAQQQQQQQLTKKKAEEAAAAATPKLASSAASTPADKKASGNNVSASASLAGTPSSSSAGGRYGFAWDLLNKRQRVKRSSAAADASGAAAAASDSGEDADSSYSRGIALARSRLGALPFRSPSGHHAGGHHYHSGAVEEIDKIAVAAELSLAMRLQKEKELASISPPRTTLVSAVNDEELKAVIAEVAEATVERSAGRLSEQLRTQRTQEDDDAQRRLLEEKLKQHQRSIEAQLRTLQEERERKEAADAARRERERQEEAARERAKPPAATHDDLVALQARIDAMLRAQEDLAKTVEQQRAEARALQERNDKLQQQHAKEQEEAIAAALERAVKEAAAAAASTQQQQQQQRVSASPAVPVLAASPSMGRTVMPVVPDQPMHVSPPQHRPRSPVQPAAVARTSSGRLTPPPATSPAPPQPPQPQLATDAMIPGISPVPAVTRRPAAPEPAPAAAIPAPTPQSRLDQRRNLANNNNNGNINASQHLQQEQRFSRVSDPLMDSEIDAVLSLQRSGAGTPVDPSASTQQQQQRMTHFVPGDNGQNQQQVYTRRTAAAARRGHIRVPRTGGGANGSANNSRSQSEQDGAVANSSIGAGAAAQPIKTAPLHTVDVSFTAPARRGARPSNYTAPPEVQQSDMSQLNNTSSNAMAPVTMADALEKLSQGAHQLLVSDRRVIKDWLVRSAAPAPGSSAGASKFSGQAPQPTVRDTIVPDVAITLVCNSPQFIRSIVVPLMIDQISAAIDRRGNVVGSDGNKTKFSQLLSAVAGLGRVASDCYPVLRTWAKLGAENADKALLALAMRATGGVLCITDAIATLKSEGASAPARNIAAYALGLLAADGSASPQFRRTRVFVFDSPVLEDAATAAQRAGANGVLSLVQLDKPAAEAASTSAGSSSSSRVAHHKLPRFARTCILMSRQAALRRALEFLSSPQALPDYDDDAIDAANWMIPPVAPQLLIEQHVETAKQLAESLQMTALGLPSWLDNRADTTAAIADSGAGAFDGSYEQLARESAAGQADPQMLPLRDVGLHLISLLENDGADSSGSVQELSLLAIPKLPRESRAMVLEPLLRIFPTLLHAHSDAHPRVVAAAATALGDAVAIVGAGAHPTLAEDATALLCNLISPTNDVTIVTACCEALAAMATSVRDETPASRIFWAWERHHLVTADSVASCLVALRATHLIAQHVLYCVSAVANHGGDRGALHRCTALVDAVAEHLSYDAIAPHVANSFVEAFLGALRMLPTETAFCVAAVRGLARIGISPGAVPCQRLDEAVTVAKQAPALPYWEELETVLESDLFAPPVKIAVVEALVKEGGAAGEVKATRIMLRHAFAWLRAAGAKALRHSTGTPIVALLLAANDTDVSVREAALGTVESLGQDRVTEALATTQRDRVKAVAQCCRDYLQFGAAETVSLILQVCESVLESEPRQ